VVCTCVCLCVSSDECQLSLLSKLMTTIVNKATKTSRAANMDAKRYEVCYCYSGASTSCERLHCGAGTSCERLYCSGGTSCQCFCCFLFIVISCCSCSVYTVAFEQQFNICTSAVNSVLRRFCVYCLSRLCVCLVTSCLHNIPNHTMLTSV